MPRPQSRPSTNYYRLFSLRWRLGGLVALLPALQACPAYAGQPPNQPPSTNYFRGSALRLCGGWAAWSLCSLPCRLVLLTQDSRPTATKPSDTNTKRLTGFAMIVFFASSKNSYNSDEIMSPVKYYGGRNYNCVNRDKPYVLDSTDLRQFVTWLCPTSKVPHLALNTYQTWNTQDV